MLLAREPYMKWPKKIPVGDIDICIKEWKLTGYGVWENEVHILIVGSDTAITPRALYSRETGYRIDRPDSGVCSLCSGTAQGIDPALKCPQRCPLDPALDAR